MISLLIAILVAGFLVYIIRTAPFIDGWFKNLAYGVVCLCLVIWLLHFSGIGGGGVTL